jgi:hypothetical protein
MSKTKTRSHNPPQSNQPAKSNKQDLVQRWIEKLIKMVQTEENKKMVQVFLVDPILNHVLERLFPYVLILCVLFVILTIMISLTLLLVFTRLPTAIAATQLR